MNLLILGGTSFLGRHLSEIALNQGHKVTLFNRGKTNPSLFPRAEHIKGDRDGGMHGLEGRAWDAVVDTSGYIPRIVKQGLSVLSGKVGHYIFISSISAYSDFNSPDIHESTPTAVLDDPQIEDITGETYGGLKALCEQAVWKTFSEKTMIVRPGLIVGPHDSTDRFTYWPHRIMQGGDILAPGRHERPVQFIDVRDLASWILLAVEDQLKGIFNATGPLNQLTMGQFLECCKSTLNPKSELIWVEDEFLLESKIGAWSELPLWIPDSQLNFLGFMQCNCKKAIDHGLQFRPMAETITDTCKWNLTRPSDYKWKSGLLENREQEILEQWKQKKGPSIS